MDILSLKPTEHLSRIRIILRFSGRISLCPDRHTRNQGALNKSSWVATILFQCIVDDKQEYQKDIDTVKQHQHELNSISHFCYSSEIDFKMFLLNKSVKFLPEE